ncbi:MAG TPA: hypothetical protein VIS76_12920 [Pseudomonadales bacterium]
MSKQLSACLLITAVLQLAGCGDEASRPETIAEPAAPAADAAPAITQRTTDGLVTFDFGGETKRFGYLPAGHNTYTPMGGSLHAAPAEQGTEQLRIVFMAIDLKALDTPTELPLPRNTGQPLSPMAAMASVGFSYTDAEGNEWAGPASITVSAFDDGRITGTFSEVTLPHTDGALPHITLTNGTFDALLD